MQLHYLKSIIILTILLQIQNQLSAKNFTCFKKSNEPDSLQIKKDSIMFAVGATWKLLSSINNQNNENLIDKNSCEVYYLTINKDNSVLKNYGLIDSKCNTLEKKYKIEINFLNVKGKIETLLNFHNNTETINYKLIEANDSNLILEEVGLDIKNQKSLNRQNFELDIPIEIVKKQFEIELKKQKVRELLQKN
jgi:hypothetical protein